MTGDLKNENRLVIKGMPMTAREKDLIACLISGKSSKKIAYLLGISHRTVETHIKNIVTKLEISSRGEIIDLIEDSDQYLEIKNHYATILSDSTGKKIFPHKKMIFQSESPGETPIAQTDGFDFGKKKKHPIVYWVGASFFLFIALSLVLLKGNNSHQRDMTIRSPLLVPHKAFLLERDPLLEEINKAFSHGKQEIQTVVISGIAGSGKTTLARLYALSQNVPIIWEVNAETNDSLIDSFETLVYELSETPEDKMELRLIRENDKGDIRKKNILSFLKKHLRSRSDWLLIYDNVESFSSIQEYFPSDHKNWGTGKVIITTRDSNISHNHYIDNAKTVRPKTLSSAEQLNLFTKILYKGNQEYQDHSIKHEIENLIKEIPPYPLDTSAVAHYIKDTKISLGKYTEYLSKKNIETFERQKEILNEVSRYPKTRYEIITASLDSIIKKNPDFEELLFFVSLLDSQNIPKDLLERDKSYKSLDYFIHTLKKYSFITDPSPMKNEEVSTFSIHRSVQQIILHYFNNLLDQNKKNSFLKKISNILENYIHHIFQKEDTLRIVLLKEHNKVFLSHSLILDDHVSSRLRNKLANIYTHLGYLPEARDLLEKNISSYEKLYGKYHAETARVLVHLGNVYVDLGNYLRAKDLLERGLPIYRKYYGEKHIETAWASVYLGKAYRHLGKYIEAKKLFEHGFSIYKAHYGENHVETARIIIHLGNIYRNLKMYPQSRDFFERGILIYEKKYGGNHIKTAWAIINLGRVYGILGSNLKAKNLLEKGLSVYKNHYGEHHVKVAWAMINLGKIYGNLGAHLKAKILFEKGLSIYEKKYGETHVKTTQAKKYLSQMSPSKPAQDLQK